MQHFGGTLFRVITISTPVQASTQKYIAVAPLLK